MKFDEMTKEELIDYINNLSEEFNGKYGLIWDKEKEPEKIVVDCDKFIPILSEQEDKSINNDFNNNVLIEGDNFHALSVLNYTHKESIDVIYIDPPYNTGNVDFMYNDKYVDLEDGYRHSKWLNFMEKRLKLARELLKPEGIIFISIDDNELYQLKILCDKIFSPQNFIANFIRKTSFGEKTAKPNINKHHDYCLCYSKSIREVVSNNIIQGEEKALSEYSNPDNDPNGPWKKDSPLIKIDSGRYGYARYPITNEYLNITQYPPVYDDEQNRKQWHYVESTFNEMVKKGQVVFYKTKEEMGNSQYSFFIKKYKSSLTNIRNNVSTLYFDNNNYTNANGTKDLVQVIGNSKSIVGLYPKPVSFIKKLIEFATIDNKDAIILDFFAGSGTTGQAVLELNKEDGGNRKFILCTNDESNICSDITYPRIKNCLQGTKTIEAMDGTLKFFKTRFVDNHGTRDQLYYDLTEKCIPMLCVKSDTYELVEKNKEYAIYSNKDKSEYSCVYFDIFGESYDEFINKIKQIDEHKNLYIFSLSEYVNEDNFKGIKNYSIEPIPYKILDLYKNVVKMSKES